MTNRISISDAELATLGELGAVQSIPIISTDGEGNATPQRTTVEALTEFIQGGSAPQPQIQTFLIPPPPTAQIFTMPSALASNGVIQPQTVRWSTVDKVVWAGDTDYYRTDGENVIITEGGVYEVTLAIGALYLNGVGTGRWNWRWIVDITSAAGTETVQGVEITPETSSNEREPTLINTTITFGSPTDSELRVVLYAQNVGPEPTPNANNEIFRLTGGDQFRRCMLTIEKAA